MFLYQSALKKLNSSICQLCKTCFDLSQVNTGLAINLLHSLFIKGNERPQIAILYWALIVVLCAAVCHSSFVKCSKATITHGCWGKENHTLQYSMQITCWSFVITDAVSSSKENSSLQSDSTVWKVLWDFHDLTSRCKEAFGGLIWAWLWPMNSEHDAHASYSQITKTDTLLKGTKRACDLLVSLIL